jgi:hypothetical protein
MTLPYVIFPHSVELFLRIRSELILEGAKRRIGGLGSSHTAPYGAAVPARPPTRCSYPKVTAEKAQWSKGANLQGTRVVVLSTAGDAPRISAIAVLLKCLAA